MGGGYIRIEIVQKKALPEGKKAPRKLSDGVFNNSDAPAAAAAGDAQAYDRFVDQISARKSKAKSKKQ